MESFLRDHPVPYYAQVKELLRTQIASGHFRPDIALTEETLATEFGVSRDTIRRALIELRTDGILVRIRGRGTFVRQSSLPRRRSRRRTVGIISQYAVLGDLDIYAHRILNAVQVSSEAQNLSLKYFCATQPSGNFLAKLREDTSLDAVLVMWMDDLKLLQGIAELPVPAVLLESIQPDGLKFDEISHDCEPAVHAAVTSLLKSGHREIAIFHGEALNELTRQRNAGFERALSDFGLPIRPELIFPMPFSANCAYDVMTRELEHGRCPTAVFCAGDSLASAVMFAALEHGLRIPRDLSVIGFGDGGGFVSPPLSTIRIPLEQMGIEAVRVVCERIRTPTSPVKRMILPGVWTPRASCGSPRTSEFQARVRTLDSHR